MAAPPTSLQSAATFSATFVAATAASVAPTLLSKKGVRPRLQAALLKAVSSARSNTRLALLPVLLPLVYRSTQRFVERHRDEHRFHDIPLVKLLREALPPLLSSPLFILLPASFRLQVVLYAISTLLYSFTRPKKAIPHEAQLEETKLGIQPSPSKPWTIDDIKLRWREYLPPIWTLSCASHAWLLWAFLYEHDCFPRRYSSIIVNHSKRYVPADRELRDVLRILGNTDHPKSLVTSPHSYVVCEVLHPAQISCSENYFAGLKDESRRAVPWVGAFAALGMIMSGKLSELRGRPVRLLLEWLEGTFRGTAYISGTITSAWGMSCLLQRLLPSGVLSKGRWLLNGAVPSALILLLSRSRQVALSMYQFRLAMLTAWRVWKAKGGRTIKHGDIILIAMCWAGLNHIRDRNETKRINGIVGQAMRMVDGTEGRDGPPKNADDEPI